MHTNSTEDTRDIQIVFECNGSDVLTFDDAAQRLTNSLLSGVQTIARGRNIDISAVTIRFVRQQTCNCGEGAGQ